MIDCNHLCYQSFYRFPEFKNGVIFGFLKVLLKLAKELGTNEFVFCWDSKQSYRRLIYPQYKRQRIEQRKPEIQAMMVNEVFPQFDYLRKQILPSMGFLNVFHQTGYEADDLCAWVVTRFPNQYVIYTSDADYFQLVRGGKYYVNLYRPTTKSILTSEILQHTTGLVGIDWAKVKSISGCSSDNVKGIEGCGENKAIRYLKGELSEGKIKNRIKENQELIDFNMILVFLPFNGIIPIRIDEIKQEKFYALDFMEVFKMLGFASLVSTENFSVWREKFQLHSGRK